MQNCPVYIILTGVHERKVFDLYNILKKNHRNYELLLFDYKDTTFSLPFVYTQKVNRLPNNNYTDFENALLKALNDHKDCRFIFIPLLDNYNGLFYQFIQSHPAMLTCLMPNLENFNICINKIQFQEFCKSNGLAVPRSFSKADIPSLKQKFIPLIVKPNTGAGSVGISFINDVSELPLLEKLDFEKFLVQEHIDNIHIEGGFFLTNKGEIVSYYGHKRIRVFPETGGVTVFSEYSYNEKLKGIGTALLKKMQWNGLAMIEFLFDPANDNYKIIELNPRLWGSFLLSEFANTGFVENYLNLCLGLPIKEFVHRADTKIRWFYPFDILLYIKRKGKISNFWKPDRRYTCYINFTYAAFPRAVLYMIYFTFNINSIRRFFKKLSPGTRKIIFHKNQKNTRIA